MEADQRFKELVQIIRHQAAMETLWGISDEPSRISEAMLQAALRHLHAVIEGDIAASRTAKAEYWDLESEM